MRWPIAMAFSFALCGCSQAPSYLTGKKVAELRFHLYSAKMGIYPDQSVLLDSNNPFASDPPNSNCAPDAGANCAAKWDLQTAAGAPDYTLAVAAFYSWATLNANAPGGENQYYTALNLQNVFLYRSDKVDPGDLPTVRTMALAGYQAVLDNFPESVTYDASGKIAYDLATPSYQAIITLGGTVPLGWVLVQKADGSPQAVHR
jgi:hypothetical protein